MTPETRPLPARVWVVDDDRAVRDVTVALADDAAVIGQIEMAADQF